MIATCSRCRERYHEHDGAKKTDELLCGVCVPRFTHVDWEDAAASNRRKARGEEETA